MGTRGTMGFIVGEQEKLAYNHFDSYPSGLGVYTLKFLREWFENHSVEELRAAANRIQVVDGDVPPTDDQIQLLMPFANLGVSTQDLNEWYVLLRETQGDWEKTLEAGFMEDGHMFPLNSLFCEWAYIINLDNETLEVYKGFQSEPHDKGRFAVRLEQPKDGYWPIRLVAVYPLVSLPTDAELCAIDEEDEAA